MPREIPRTRADLVPLLESRGLRLSRRLGQNFLVDAQLADAIVRDAGAGPGDHVVEIGPGAGALTQPLLAAGARVTAVEIDRGLFALLEDHLGDHSGLELVHGDCLAKDGLHPAIESALSRPTGRVLVVANLPYSAGTPALLRLLAHPRAPDLVVAMLQAEVVDRLRAAPGSADHGPAAVLVAARCDIELVRRVPAEVFFPRPKVESAVVRITPRADGAEIDGRALLDIVSTAFRHRRKTVGRNLGDVPRDVLAAAGIDPSVRPQDVSVGSWVALVRELRGSARP